MKILFVLENYLPHIGGVEIVFKTLAEELAEKKHDVHIVTHRMKKTKKYEIINKVKVHRVRCFRSRYLFTFFSLPKVLWLARNADIIHTTTFNGAPPAWFASKLLRKPVVITVHEVWVNMWDKLSDMPKFKAKFHNFLEGLVYKLKYDWYAAVSRSTQKQLYGIGIDPDKISVVYNAVDYEHFDPSKYDWKEIRKKYGLEGKYMCLVYGRPGVSKGIEYAVKAFPHILEKIEMARLFLILSKDPAYKKMYNNIVELIKELGIEDKVLLHDPVNFKELPRYIRSADCVIVPSLAEGFGFTAAEACAMNRPVVASNTTSLPEVVSGRFVLVEPKNPEAIAKAVFELFKGKVKAKKLKKFEVEDNVNGYMDIYKNLI